MCCALRAQLPIAPPSSKCQTAPTMVPERHAFRPTKNCIKNSTPRRLHRRPTSFRVQGAIAAKLAIIPPHSRHHKSWAWAPRALADRAAMAREPAGTARIGSLRSRNMPGVCLRPGCHRARFCRGAPDAVKPDSSSDRPFRRRRTRDPRRSGLVRPREGCGTRPTSAHWAQPLRQRQPRATCAGLTS
jgi:hypothetical protein